MGGGIVVFKIRRRGVDFSGLVAGIGLRFFSFWRREFGVWVFREDEVLGRCFSEEREVM